MQNVRNINKYKYITNLQKKIFQIFFYSENKQFYNLGNKQLKQLFTNFYVCLKIWGNIFYYLFISASFSPIYT